MLHAQRLNVAYGQSQVIRDLSFTLHTGETLAVMGRNGMGKTTLLKSLIGMLLMQEPQLLLLDEPVAGMSAREREATAELLKRIAAGRALVVIEHDMGFVSSIAHTVTVLHQGKLLAEGSMEEVQRDARVVDVYLGH